MIESKDKMRKGKYYIRHCETCNTVWQPTRYTSTEDGKAISKRSYVYHLELGSHGLPDEECPRHEEE